MRRFLSAASSLYRVDRSQWVVPVALYNVPGIALALLGGVAAGHHIAGVFAASGAMSVGFGCTHRIGRLRWAPMLVAAAGMAISTLTGSLAGHRTWALLIVVGVWGFAGGLIASLGKAFTYIGLQCLVALLVTSNYTVPVSSALVRAGITLLGGLAQLGLILLFWKLEQASHADPTPPVAPSQPPLQILYNNLSYRADGFQHGLRVAVALVYATLLGRHFALGNSYWLPMTVAIVLKPSFDDTLSRGLSRIVGTLVGAALATLIAVLLHPTPVLLALLCTLFAGLAYLLLNVNYTAFAVCITGYVVFLLSLVGLPEAKIVHYRIINTALGGGLAMLMHARISHTRYARRLFRRDRQAELSVP